VQGNYPLFRSTRIAYTMGFLKFNKKKVWPKKHDDVRTKASSDKAPVSEVKIQISDGKKRSNKRAPSALNSRLLIESFTDYDGSDNGKQLHHKSHLFELSQRLVDETPPERRQSVATAITGVVTEESPRPPSPANDYNCIPTITPRTIKVMTQDAMDKKQSDKPNESVALTLLMLNFQACSDTMCAAYQDQNEIEFSPPVLESGPATIPREISFLPISLRDESQLSEAERSKYSMLDLNNNGKPSLLRRITGKLKGEDTDNSIMSRLKVFVDTPSRCGADYTDADSVDESLLTMPPMRPIP
jgi:hypothetical protein